MRAVDNSCNQHLVDNAFFNAFDEFNQVNRKLFEIPEIDNLLSFSNKKNICIQNQTYDHSKFLHYIITKICINRYAHDSRTNSNKFKEVKTILIDAGNGNNLGYIYLDLTKLAIQKEIDINSLLDSIMIVRAFTFYQLSNILINELPTLLTQTRNKLQIIVLDLFDTLVSNSRIKTKGFENNGYSRSRDDLKDNIGIVNELIDVLISLSEKNFMILAYKEGENITCANSIVSKFDNAIKIKQVCNGNKETFEIKSLNYSKNQSSIAFEGDAQVIGTIYR